MAKKNKKSTGRGIAEKAGVASKCPTPRRIIKTSIGDLHVGKEDMFVPGSKTGGFEKDSGDKYIFRLPDFDVTAYETGPPRGFKSRSPLRKTRTHSDIQGIRRPARLGKRKK